MKFRKKPIIVEAEQYLGYYHTPYPTGVKIEDNSNDPEALTLRGRYAPYVITAHGQRAYLETGDWVIEEPDGRGYYPCKPDIFEQTFEPVISQDS